jgi:Tol biopolymer transport system component
VFSELDNALWSTPTNVGGPINSGSADLQPALSPDALALYFVSNRNGGRGGSDIWVSRRATTTSAWGAPVNLGAGVNSNGADASPAFSQDGQMLFFQSDRAGGRGLMDLYVSFRDDVTRDAWSTPVNLGLGVNSGEFEGGAHYSQAFETLFFGRGPSDTNLDIYKITFRTSTRATDGAPERVPELSTLTGSNDAHPTLRGDELEIIFASDRAGGLNPASSDLWYATRASRSSAWGTPVHLRTLSSVDNDVTPTLSFDGKTLFFASNRAGGLGGSDIWMTTRTAVSR